jgi:DNA invertase Pin-like site-specific DNA recombinase
MAEGVPFICADLGRDTDPFLLHIFAAFAEKERRMICIRTREGLARARARGMKFGGENERSRLSKEEAECTCADFATDPARYLQQERGGYIGGAPRRTVGGKALRG